MKLSLILLTLFASLGVRMQTCSSKSNTSQTAAYQLPDLWIGTYTVDQYPDQPPLYYSLTIKPGGSLIAEGKGADGVSYYSAGTWAITGDSLKCIYTSLNYPGHPVKQTAKFLYNNSTGKLSGGSWKDVANAGNSGAFSVMERVN